VVDEALVAPVPADLDFTIAASFGLVYATATTRSRTARDQGGRDAARARRGGRVGLAAVELGKLFGARVIACASSDEKLETCSVSAPKSRSTTSARTCAKPSRIWVAPSTSSWIRSAERFPSLPCARWPGRDAISWSASPQARSEDPAQPDAAQGCSIVGVFWGEFARRERELNAANLKELTAGLRAKKIKPLVSASYPLERAAEALTT